MKAWLKRRVNETPKLGSFGSKWAKYKWQVRREIPHRDPTCELLRSFGYVAIPNFINRATVQRIQEEYFHVKNNQENREWISCGCCNHAVVGEFSDPRWASVYGAFWRNPLIVRGVETITRRKLYDFPSTFSVLRQRQLYAWPPNDSNALMHRDVDYPTVKVVLYLYDVTRDNAPFTFWTRTSSQPVAITGEAGTLIIADHSCFHKRGRFIGPNVPRTTLRISFRYMESIKYRWLHRT